MQFMILVNNLAVFVQFSCNFHCWKANFIDNFLVPILIIFVEYSPLFVKKNKFYYLKNNYSQHLQNYKEQKGSGSIVVATKFGAYTVLHAHRQIYIGNKYI